MKQKNSYNYNELIDCANGVLFGEGNARLPSPPMLMFDRITQIQSGEGKFKKGIKKFLQQLFITLCMHLKAQGI